MIYDGVDWKKPKKIQLWDGSNWQDGKCAPGDTKG
jgi:hypothetical protein